MADMVLIAHIAFILFVVVGLFLIVAGGFRGWRWIRNLWLRLVHVAAIGVVAIESWLGITCPLTTLEIQLRRSAGQVVSGDDFIASWLRHLFFFQAPPWVFTLCYSAFLAVVVATWLFFPPKFRSGQ